MPGLQYAVTTAIYAQANARVQMNGMMMGQNVRYLSPGELANTGDLSAPNSLGAQRTWEYYCRRAGCMVD